MGATIDLNIISNKYIEVKKIIQLIEAKFKKQININNIEVMDNWEYENVIKISNSNEIGKYIEQSKIITIELLLPNNVNAGIQVQKIDTKYETDIWMNIDNFACLDCDYINEKNKPFYDNIINLILSLVEEYDINIVTLGIETIFEYNKDISKMINESHNIIVWIIAGKYPQCINEYKLRENKELNLGIFTKDIL